MSESDGIEEAVRGSIRGAVNMAISIGGYAGQQAAERIAQRNREQQRASEQAAREMQARYDAERAAARSQVAVVNRPEWWDRATPEQIGKVWETVETWRSQDPAWAQQASETIATEVSSRYEVDVRDLVARQQAERTEQLRQAAQQRSEYERAKDWAREHEPSLYARHEADFMAAGTAADGEKLRARLVETWQERTAARADVDPAVDQERAAARVDEAAAAAVMVEPLQSEADRVDAEQEAEVLYDSAERRQQLADRLEKAGIDPDAREARLISDASQAVPTNQAIRRAKKAPKARRTRTAGRQQEQTLGR
jgi:hypothetical protein